MNTDSILGELKSNCSFLEVFEDTEEGEGGFVYRRKIGHIRADYNGYRWWNSVWPCHNELCTSEISKEIDMVYERLTASDAFSTLSSMAKFCMKHPQAVVNGSNSTEYNFFYEGEHCFFWIRCITRYRDYNLYVHAFTKE